MLKNKKLKTSDFDFRFDGNTKPKLEILQYVLNIEKSHKMLDIFSDNNLDTISLYSEKLCGNTNTILRYIFDPQQNKYIPNTVLNRDIRDITVKILRIVSICCKPYSDTHQNFNIIYLKILLMKI